MPARHALGFNPISRRKQPVRASLQAGLQHPGIAARELRASEDDKVGIGIVRKTLADPARWVASNAGKEGSIVVDKIRSGQGSFGFNTATEEFEDLMKAGIIDPTKVVRSALQNAASGQACF